MSNGKHLGIGSTIPTLPDDGKLRLYSMRFCPFAHRVHLVLDAKEIPYHTIFINLSEKPEWLTEKSPLGKVPALELVNEKSGPTIFESLIVTEYLDEKYPEKPLYPKDPLQKAQDKILIERFAGVAGTMYKIYGSDSKGASVLVEELSDALDIYEKELQDRGTPYFGGDKPGMLDYMIWPWCERSDMMPFLHFSKHYVLDKERFASLLTWRALMIEDPAVKATYLDGETHAKFIKLRFAGTPDYDMLVNANKRQRTV